MLYHRIEFLILKSCTIELVNIRQTKCKVRRVVFDMRIPSGYRKQPFKLVYMSIIQSAGCDGWVFRLDCKVKLPDNIPKLFRWIRQDLQNGMKCVELVDLPRAIR